jgi:hypothetical protein
MGTEEFWAHLTFGQTGLSACIFSACGAKGYRFNPLRGRTPAHPSGTLCAGPSINLIGLNSIL